MDYVNLGNTGLKISRLCLGMMSFAFSRIKMKSARTRPADEGLPFVKKGAGGSRNQLFDTADVYSNGISEEITGKALKKYAKRDEVVIATKVFFGTHLDEGAKPNQIGLSRKHILDAVDGSLQRLDTDYIDLYQIHRWDPETPIEETMEALHDVVRAGKVRDIGASSMATWQFAKAQYTADLNGWTRFIDAESLQSRLPGGDV